MKHLLQEELRVCEIYADQYGSNYHAWQHRMWCMIQLTKDVDCWLQEWHRLERWVSFHVSDHSGLHYRQFLLKHLLQLPAPPGMNFLILDMCDHTNCFSYLFIIFAIVNSDFKEGKLKLEFKMLENPNRMRKGGY